VSRKNQFSFTRVAYKNEPRKKSNFISVLRCRLISEAGGILVEDCEFRNNVLTKKWANNPAPDEA
jgi:hypothetical protein